MKTRLLIIILSSLGLISIFLITTSGILVSPNDNECYVINEDGTKSKCIVTTGWWGEILPRLSPDTQLQNCDEICKSERQIDASRTNIGVTENNCGQFYTAPKIQYDSNTVPVLLMDSNSTGCARLTFTIYDNPPDASWSKIANFTSTLFIGNYNYTSHGIIFSVSPGKDYTNSFQIIVTPEIVDLTNFSAGSNFTVTYIIKPLSNSTGFYDHSISMLPCHSYPIAIGNTADQLSYSDFSYIYPTPHSCMVMSYILTAVEISGISYDYITLPVEPPNN
jgi:hypothetical protein